ncbi:MAG: hypothetical protein ACC645_26740, partial [Pirellulales bacterium]
IARRHLLAKLDLEQKLERMRQLHTLDDEQFKHLRLQEQQRLDAKLEDESKLLVRERQRKDAGRDDQVKDAQAKAEEVRIKMAVAKDAIELGGHRAAQKDKEESQRIARE